jgi:hypothetical protein
MILDLRLPNLDRRKSSMHRELRFFCLALVGSLFALWQPVQAQVREKVVRIGTLGAGGGMNSASRRWDPFRHGLRELGYLEGKNIVIESRSAMDSWAASMRLPVSSCASPSL